MPRVIIQSEVIIFQNRLANTTKEDVFVAVLILDLHHKITTGNIVLCGKTGANGIVHRIYSTHMQIGINDSD